MLSCQAVKVIFIHIHFYGLIFFRFTLFYNPGQLIILDFFHYHFVGFCRHKVRSGSVVVQDDNRITTGFVEKRTSSSFHHQDGASGFASGHC